MVEFCVIDYTHFCPVIDDFKTSNQLTIDSVEIQENEFASSKHPTG